MDTQRVLLMHISNISGHRCASQAIEKTLHNLDQNVQVLSIDAFNYTNPFWERLINRLYMFVIQAEPQIWEYLYDNEQVLRNIKRIRAWLHRLNERKIKKLFADFNPDIVVSTQAFPCGMVADYKRRHNLSLTLIGVLTDYAPHRYWLNDFVDVYVVPAGEIKQKLIQRGISEKRIQVLGIPIDDKFASPVNREETLRHLGLDASLPVILIMGGGQGLGPLKEIVQTLDRLNQRIQLIVVCGTNKSLERWLNKNRPGFHQPVSVLGYTDQIDALMTVSTLIVTKPGGLTSSEALSKALAMIIFSPLPGQESLNTQFLLQAQVALKADSFSELQSLVEELLTNRGELERLRENARALAHPDAALNIARLILTIIAQRKVN